MTATAQRPTVLAPDADVRPAVLGALAVAQLRAWAPEIARMPAVVVARRSSYRALKGSMDQMEAAFARLDPIEHRLDALLGPGVF